MRRLTGPARRRPLTTRPPSRRQTVPRPRRSAHKRDQHTRQKPPPDQRPRQPHVPRPRQPYPHPHPHPRDHQGPPPTGRASAPSPDPPAEVTPPGPTAAGREPEPGPEVAPGSETESGTGTGRGPGLGLGPGPASMSVLNQATAGQATSAARDVSATTGRRWLPALAMCALHVVVVPAVGAGTIEVTTGVAEAAAPYAEAAPGSGPTAPTPERSWPDDGPAGTRPVVLRGWEPPPTPWAAGHRGVDLAASDGAVVRAATPGQIAFVGTVAGRGVLTIEVSGSGHPPLHTTYEPIRATVHKGQRVTAGQPVGMLADGPYHCRAPCLHWGLRRGTAYLNPLSLMPPTAFRNGPSRLLPVFGIPLPGGVPTVGPYRPHREHPAPTAHETTDMSAGTTGAALLGAVTLAGAALWALGRLRRPAKGSRRARLRSPSRWAAIGKGRRRRCGVRAAVKSGA
ncbi:peptidoglycan DD-metalloendopeptidase family protein [Streptomyces noursei]|uniref:murein hydrolase activator EnvC family protein n=2 Tax=Streptomyces noursei TaxID=1971 RepID=UPI003796BCAC